MNLKLNPRLLRLLACAHVGAALLSLPPARAQVAPTRTVDAATLAKYDTNKNGVLDPSEQAALDADRGNTSANAATKPSDEVVTLSPFEVVSDTKGYYSSNTMSGTRFNTKLEDLASSISVITKEQMADFAMLDINDVFLYTANTEGTGTYTDFAVDRNGQPVDNSQLNPTMANRVRGIAPANISFGNIEMMGRVPVDPLGIDSLEVSRGPNANVFGLGNPSGTVNMVPASANLSRNRSQAVERVDSYGGYRTSLDLNRVLVDGKLAVRANGSFQHDAFIRKPSGINTVRYNAMVKYRPFKYTTITAGYSWYRMNGNRPNNTPPRDDISYWVASGKPGWDPVNQVIHVNGQTIGAGGPGTTTPITADTTIPDYFNRTFAGKERSFLYIDQNGLSYWTTPTTNNPASNPFTPAANGQTIRFFATSPAPGTNLGKYVNQPLFSTTPSIVSKSIYDWSSINLSAVNRLMDRTETPMVQLDQILLNTPEQRLTVQFGFLRENSQRYQRTPLGDAKISGSTGLLQIDPNERLLDGSPNPYFGRPFIGVVEPLTKTIPARWDTTRAQLAYQLDFSRQKTALHWLGSHQLTGYDEFKYRTTRTYSFRDVFVDDHAWIAAGTPRGNSGGATGGPNIVRGFFRYYVGDNNGANVDYAPTDFKYGPTTFTWGGYTIASGLPVAGSGVFRHEPAVIGQVESVDGAGGGNNTLQIIKTMGGVIQSHFLDDQIVTTFGLRRDKTFSKQGNTPTLAFVSPDGLHVNYELMNHWQAGDYRVNSGPTKTGGVVARPFRDLAFLRRSAREGGTVTSFLAETLRGLSFTYNRSDSFTPLVPAQDLYRNILPNPTGKGKDYGVWLNMFDGRLVVRVNRYETKQINARNGDANTIAQRLTRYDVPLSTDAFTLQTQATAWVSQLNPNFTPQQVQAEVARQMGLSTEVQNALVAPNPNLAATNDIIAKGTELEINYNPTKYWTVAANASEGRVVNTNVSSSISKWISERMPIWTTIVDPRTNTLWWNTSYGGAATASANYASFVQAPFAVIQQQQGKSNPQVRRYNFKTSTSYRLAGLTENRFLKKMSLGGALRWEDKGAIGYYGVQQLPAVITALDQNRPVYDKAHYYVDAFLSYRTRLWADKIGATFQLNVRNIQESGRLQPIAAFPDGTPSAYRIVDPRQFILTASFDL